MNSYRLEEIDPPLNETELFLLDVVGALWMAQAQHQFPPDNAPRLRDFMKEGRSEWRNALKRHYEEHGYPKPGPLASLDHLWNKIQRSHSFSPTRREGDDLFFETFGISQRFIDEPPSPSRRWARWYFVGYPTASHSFRCVANEASNRKFITVNPFSRCEPPGAQDFLAVSVSRMGVNYKTGERRPTVGQHYLPSCFGPWKLIKHDMNQDEEIV